MDCDYRSQEFRYLGTVIAMLVMRNYSVTEESAGIVELN